MLGPSSSSKAKVKQGQRRVLLPRKDESKVRPRMILKRNKQSKIPPRWITFNYLTQYSLCYILRSSQRRMFMFNKNIEEDELMVAESEIIPTFLRTLAERTWMFDPFRNRQFN